MTINIFKIAKKIKATLWQRNTHHKSSLITDVFESGYNKKALLSYIIHDFYNKKWEDCAGISHTNVLESKAFATELHQRGYAVDIVDYLDKHELQNAKHYNLVCGFGYPFEKMLSDETRASRVHIFYGTGCHTAFSNKETMKSKFSFFNSYGFWPSLGAREVAHSWPVQNTCSDYYIALGNEFVSKTYKKNIVYGEVLRLDAFYLDGKVNCPPFIAGNKSIKKNILWFGSSGAIHKGLILTLEALRAIPDLHLHVVGLADQERACLKLEQIFIDILDRVHFHGFLRVGSGEFFEVMKSCGIISFPSCSEGGCPSVLTAGSYGGGVPVVTKSCGLSIENYGIVIPDNNVEQLVSAFKKIIALPIDEHLLLINKAKDHFASQYSLQKYRNNLSAIFDYILESKLGAPTFQ